MARESAAKTMGLHLIMAAALITVAGLALLSMPTAAYAQEDSGASSLSGLATQSAGKTSLWVVASITSDGNDGKVTSKLSYNSNGLVKGSKSPLWSTSIKYSGLRETSSTSKVKENGYSCATKAKLKYDKSGRLTKTTLTRSETYPDGQKASSNDSEKYTYDSKGRLVKLVEVRDPLKTTHVYSKFDKQGRPQKETTTTEVGGTENSDQVTLKYDSHGNLKYYGNGKSGKLTLKYDSKNRLVSKTRTSTNKGCKYTYKKVSVPKNAVAAVKRQQLEITNEDLPSIGLIARRSFKPAAEV